MVAASAATASILLQAIRIDNIGTMKKLLQKLFGKRARDEAPEIMRARQLIRAVDAGGIPLDPRIVTRIAESLGLEVSRHARPEDTIERIRTALRRCHPY